LVIGGGSGIIRIWDARRLFRRLCRTSVGSLGLVLWGIDLEVNIDFDLVIRWFRHLQGIVPSKWKLVLSNGKPPSFCPDGLGFSPSIFFARLLFVRLGSFPGIEGRRQNLQQ
jgi:hypothetical protein